MTCLTSSKVPFIWGDEKEKAFKKIKKTLSQAPVLAYVNPNKPFIIESDASNFSVGAMLFQEQDDGIEHPVAFYSHKMLPVETNYPIYDKKLLEIIFALEEWQHYLINTKIPFIIRMDHKSLKYFKFP